MILPRVQLELKLRVCSSRSSNPPWSFPLFFSPPLKLSTRSIIIITLVAVQFFLSMNRFEEDRGKRREGNEIRKGGNYFGILERFDENWMGKCLALKTYVREGREAFGKWNIISIDMRNVKYLSSAFVTLFLEWRIRKRGWKNELLLDNQIHSRTCLNSPSFAACVNNDLSGAINLGGYFSRFIISFLFRARVDRCCSDPGRVFIRFRTHRGSVKPTNYPAKRG